MKKKIGIIGATGYVGSELIRILMNHNYVEIVAISSNSFKGENLSNIYPNFKKIINLICGTEEEVVKKSDIIFTALPHGFSENIAKNLDNDKVLIDIGADFRLDSEENYFAFYNKKFNNPKLHANSVYSIPELHRANVLNQNIIANPGCYPTSIGLGLAPAVLENLIANNSIIIDAKSGVTGAGRMANENSHFISCNENLKPYAIAGVHRHIPEIEQIINGLSDNNYMVSFTPHLLPINRGILSTIYFNLNTDISEESVRNLYKKFYKDEKFVVVLDKNEIAQIRNVKGSNYCHISVHKDYRCNRIIIISVIDNIIKGAAGQAVQNMNLRFRFNEDEGLNLISNIF